MANNFWVSRFFLFETLAIFGKLWHIFNLLIWFKSVKYFGQGGETGHVGRRVNRSGSANREQRERRAMRTSIGRREERAFAKLAYCLCTPNEPSAMFLLLFPLLSFFSLVPFRRNIIIITRMEIFCDYDIIILPSSTVVTLLLYRHLVTRIRRGWWSPSIMMFYW